MWHIGKFPSYFSSICFFLFDLLVKQNKNSHLFNSNQHLNVWRVSTFSKQKQNQDLPKFIQYFVGSIQMSAILFFRCRLYRFVKKSRVFVSNLLKWLFWNPPNVGQIDSFIAAKIKNETHTHKMNESKIVN